MIEISNYINEKDAAELIQFCASFLNINDVKLIIVNDNKVLDNLSTKDIELQALLSKTSVNKTYRLVIRKYTTESIDTIICHEMVHLSQYESNKLKLNLDKKEFIWLGKIYDNLIPYLERPWEIEAFSKQKILLKTWKAYKKSINKKKK